MILMAAALAGRGAGTCAASPSRPSNTTSGVVESGTLTAQVATSGISLSDDGVSCDHDGYLDPGESGTLRITVANTGIVAAEDTVVRATTTAPGVTVGRPINLGNLAALSHVDLEIPVSVAASAPTALPSRSRSPSPAARVATPGSSRSRCAGRPASTRPWLRPPIRSRPSSWPGR